MNLIANAQSRFLGLLRRGSPRILWAQSSVRGGNLLYYWLQASIGRTRNEDLSVLRTDAADLWLESFPRLGTLSKDSRDVRFIDPRIVPGPLQTFGEDFVRDDVDRFIEDYLMSEPQFVSNVISNSMEMDLSINVRRGDYYSNPRWRGEYSFDVVEYIRSALQFVVDQSPIRSIHVISDDIDWCKVKLDHLIRDYEHYYCASTVPVINQFALLGASPRLILANSTFSYWGGYISSWRSRKYPSSMPSGIWAPAFHNRYLPNGGRATQLDPSWNVIEEIPGGWDG